MMKSRMLSTRRNPKRFNLFIKCRKELQEFSKNKSPKKREQLVNSAKDCVIDAISEISSNCLKGNIPLNKCKYSKLKKYKNALRNLQKPNLSRRTKRNIISQKGGFLQILIPAALSVLTSYLASK